MGLMATVPLPGFYITSLASGWDGAIWVSGASTSHFGELARVSTSGEVEMLDVPETGGTDDIARGPDGAMWFRLWGGLGLRFTSRLDSITSEGLPGAPACIDDCRIEPLTLATSPDGSLVYAGALPAGTSPSGSGGLTALEDARARGGTIGHLGS